MKLSQSIKICLFLSLAAGIALPQQTHAQFWKKLFGGHKKEAPDRQQEEKEQQEAPEKKEDVLKNTYPPTVKKGRYRIDVLLPLNLNQYVTENRRNGARLSSLTQQSVDFYKGMRVAAQKLNEEGVPVDMYVQDVGAGEERLRQLIKGNRLQGSDLLIGFLPSDQLPEAARFARQQQVNLFSAFSPSDANVSENPYFILLQPTLATHISRMVAFSEQKYKLHRPPILLYANETPVQQESMSLFEKALEGTRADTLAIARFLKDPETFAALADSQQLQVVFVNLLAYGAAEKVLQQLAVLSAHFKLAVFGMPSWKYMPLQKLSDGYRQMDIYCSTPFYFNTNDTKGSALAIAYKQIFGGSPSEMSFRGYETMYWAAHLLYTYGTGFNQHLRDDRMAPFTRFDVAPVTSDKDQLQYLENRHLYIFHYANGYFNIAAD